MTGAIIVTGGASGIGRAVTEGVLEAGWKAVVFDLSGKALEETRAAFDPARLRCAAVNVVDEAAVAAEIAAIEAEFGPIEGVVNSAGIAADTAAMETGVDVFRRILDVNVVGSFIVAREATRFMRGRGGAIVNIASVSGIRGNEGRAAYGASKGAVLTMSMVMAVEFAPLDVRVNVVAPGPIDTPLVRDLHDQTSRSFWVNAVPMRRYGAPEDVAAAVVFLLDGKRSGYVTGQTLCVDGGFTATGVMTGKSLAGNRGQA